jgi:hypothetical protein
MRRRDFLSGLVCAATTTRIAGAQNASNAIRKIGVVTLGVPQSAPIFLAFITGLSELGYEPGINIILEFRSAQERRQITRSYRRDFRTEYRDTCS